MYSIFNQRPLSVHDMQSGAAATLHREIQLGAACHVGLVPIWHPNNLDWMWRHFKSWRHLLSWVTGGKFSRNPLEIKKTLVLGMGGPRSATGSCTSSTFKQQLTWYKPGSYWNTIVYNLHWQTFKRTDTVVLNSCFIVLYGVLLLHYI